MTRSDIADAPVVTAAPSPPADPLGPRRASRAPSVAAGRSASRDLERLGQRIRKLRGERQLTLKQVELLSGLSATHLSEIERGRTSPTIGALTRIARSLHRDPSYFIESEERFEVACMRQDERRPFELSPGVTADERTPGIPASQIHAYRIRIEAGANVEWRWRPDSVPGEIVLLVLHGAIEAVIGGSKTSLAAGDAAQASLALPLRLRSGSRDGAELIATMTRPLEAVA